MKQKITQFLRLSFILTSILWFSNAARAVSCGRDTVDYTLAKATDISVINISNTVPSAGQYFNCPQAITIYGFDFYAFTDSPAVTLGVTATLYRAGADSLPTGAPLRTVTVTIDTATTDLNATLNHAVFSAPITINYPYVLVVTNTSTSFMGLIFNNYPAGDGLGDYLSMAKIGTVWYRSNNLSVGGTPLDADALFLPVVDYNIRDSFTVNKSSICSGDSITFTDASSPILRDPMYNYLAFVASTGVSYTYNFGDGSSPLRGPVNTHTYSIANTYNVTLYDSMVGWRAPICASSYTRSVLVTPRSTTSAFSSSTTSLTANFTNTSTGASGYRWYYGDGSAVDTARNPSHTYTLPNTYTVCLVAFNSCARDSICHSVTVTCASPVTPNRPTGDSIVCPGDTITISTDPVAGATAYTWTLPGTWSGTSTTNSIRAVVGASGGTVSVGSSNICGTSSTVSRTYTIGSAPASPAPVSGTLNMCTGNTYTLNATSVARANSYTWSLPAGFSGSSTTNSIDVIPGSAMAAGSYVITCTATNNCGTSGSATFTAIVNTLPTVVSAINGDATVCFGDTVIFYINSSPGITTYNWTIPSGWSGTSTDTAISVVVGDSSGTVQVSGSNYCGTSAASTFTVSRPGHILASGTTTNATSSTASDGTASVSSASGGQGPYQFSIDGGAFGSVPTFTGLATGSHEITVRDANGCIKVLTLAVGFDPGTGIQAISGIRNLEVFPNPASSTVQVQFSLKDIEAVRIDICDLSGRTIMSFDEGNIQKMNKSFDIAKLPAGSYVMRIQSGAETQIRKLSKY